MYHNIQVVHTIASNSKPASNSKQYSSIGNVRILYYTSYFENNWEKEIKQPTTTIPMLSFTNTISMLFIPSTLFLIRHLSRNARMHITNTCCTSEYRRLTTRRGNIRTYISHCRHRDNSRYIFISSQVTISYIHSRYHTYTHSRYHPL